MNVDRIELNPVEGEEDEVEEAATAKLLKSPSAPSRQEMLEHSLNHYPFRSWCIHCVKGKSKSSKHSTTGGMEESSVPVVGFDYAFLSDRTASESAEDEDGEQGRDNVASDVLKVLVGHDSKSKTCTAIPVPQKGLDPEEWAVRESI